MDQILKEYIEYYRIRMMRYKDNPMYKNSYEAEKALFEAISSCTILEEFKDKIGNLNIKAAVAFLKDKYKALSEHYKKLKEDVRAKGAEEIFEKIDKADIKTDMDVANFVSDVEQKYSQLILKDEMGITEFKSDIDMLENIQTWENAKIVDEFKDEVNVKDSQEEREKGQKDWEKRVLPEIKKWFPDWNIDYNAILKEERHRKKLPFPDKVVKERIDQHKLYRGTK